MEDFDDMERRFVPLTHDLLKSELQLQNDYLSQLIKLERMAIVADVRRTICGLPDEQQGSSSSHNDLMAIPGFATSAESTERTAPFDASSGQRTDAVKAPPAPGAPELLRPDESYAHALHRNKDAAELAAKKAWSENDSVLPVPTLFSADLVRVPEDRAATEASVEPQTWQIWVQDQIVEHPFCDAFITFVIILNAMTMGIQSNWMVTHLGQTAPQTFDIFEAVFVIIFTSELVLRLFAYGQAFFYEADWQWNLFDLAVVGLQLFEMISAAAVGDANDTGSGNLSFMRVIKVLRLFRILRLIRVLRFVEELRNMVSSIVSSLRPLLWTTVLLLLLMYTSAVALAQMIAEAGTVNPELMQQETDLQSYYGDLPRTILSLFQAMTSGVDWNELLKPLEKHISPWLAILFSMYITFAVLAMMNVVTGIFVESALTSSRADRERDLVQQVEKLFRTSDTDGNGILAWDEFKAQIDMRESPVTKCFESLGIETQEARGLFTLLDTDHSDSIDLNEFIDGCLHLRGEARSIDLVTLMYSSKRSFEHNKQVQAFVMESLDLIMETLVGRRGGGGGSQDRLLSVNNMRDKVLDNETYYGSWREVQSAFNTTEAVTKTKSTRRGMKSKRDRKSRLF